MINTVFQCCAGLDVHKAQVTVTIIRTTPAKHEEKLQREFQTFRNNLMEMSIWLKQAGIELAVMESTGIYWKTVYEVLESEGVKAIVVNARHVKNVPGRKTDVMDSEWLAELGRYGLLRASFIPPKDIRELRILTRHRRKLSGILSSQKNRLHKTLDDCGIRLGTVVSDIDGVSSRKMIEALIEGKLPIEEIAKLGNGALRKKQAILRQALDGHISERHRFLLAKIMDHIRFLEKEINEIDQKVFAAMESDYKKEWEILQTIPGMDKISAAILLTEIGVDMTRFGSASRLCSWAGMCPGNNESAGKKKAGRTRHGNRYIRSILCEVANAAIKTKCQFRGIYKGLVIRRGHKRAIVAIGHRILKVVYALLSRKEAYKDPEIDYEALIVNRNAPRWIQALRKYGFLDKNNHN